MLEASVAVVVPCYNPLEDWQKHLIRDYTSFTNSISATCELVLINDGSTRGVDAAHIEEITEALGKFKYQSYNQNQGKGHALRQGLQLTEAPLVLTTDIDFPYTNESMVALHSCLQENGGLVLGHRKRNYYQKVPLFRKLLSLAFRAIIKLFIKLEVDDTQCGLKGLDRAAQQVFSQTQVKGYLYDLELVKLSTKKKLKISRVNAVLKPSIEFTNMSFKILLKESGNLFKILWL